MTGSFSAVGTCEGVEVCRSTTSTMVPRLPSEVSEWKKAAPNSAETRLLYIQSSETICIISKRNYYNLKKHVQQRRSSAKDICSVWNCWGSRQPLPSAGSFGLRAKGMVFSAMDHKVSCTAQMFILKFVPQIQQNHKKILLLRLSRDCSSNQGIANV